MSRKKKQVEKFKIGDYVYAKRPKNTTAMPTWSVAMDNLVGKTLTITDISYGIGGILLYSVRESSYLFRGDWLTPAKSSQLLRKQVGEDTFETIRSILAEIDKGEE